MEIHALQDKILKTVVDELVFNKITHFFSAPGSRSAPLIVNAANHPLLTLHTYFDERGLGFFALGTAKGARAPVCLITTSGSAPANLLPAVIEAYYSEVPLFIITCDRPEPLHEIGSNQTIEQKDIFKPFTAHSCTIRTTELTLSPTAVAGKIAFLAHLCRGKNLPVHVNLSIEDPNSFVSVAPPRQIRFTRETEWTETRPEIEEETLDMLVFEIAKEKSGLIVIGSGTDLVADEINALSDRLGWPVFADISSCQRCPRLKHALKYVSYYDDEMLSDLEINAVLHFGNRCVEKNLFLFLQRQSKGKYFHVDVSHHRYDPYFLNTHEIPISPARFCKAITRRIEKKEPASFPELFHIKTTGTISGPEIPLVLSEIDLSRANLFIANSLIIRYFDTLFFPKIKPIAVYTQRGASGIDGNIAHAIGIARSTKLPLLVFLGDYTFLHDLSSLFLLHDKQLPVTFFIMNNYGGCIHENVLKKVPSPTLHKHIVRTHNYPIKSTLLGMGFRCEEITLWDSLKDRFEKALAADRPQFYEICSTLQQDTEFERKAKSHLHPRHVRHA